MPLLQTDRQTDRQTEGGMLYLMMPSVAKII